MHDPADAEIVKKIKAQEIELIDRNSLLRGTKPVVRVIASFVDHAHSLQDFSSLRTMFNERLKKMKEAQKKGGPVPSSTSRVDPKMQAMKASE